MFFNLRFVFFCLSLVFLFYYFSYFSCLLFAFFVEGNKKVVSHKKSASLSWSTQEVLTILLWSEHAKTFFSWPAGVKNYLLTKLKKFSMNFVAVFGYPYRQDVKVFNKVWSFQKTPTRTFKATSMKNANLLAIYSKACLRLTNAKNDSGKDWQSWTIYSTFQALNDSAANAIDTGMSQDSGSSGQSPAFDKLSIFVPSPDSEKLGLGLGSVVSVCCPTCTTYQQACYTYYSHYHRLMFGKTTHQYGP